MKRGIVLLLLALAACKTQAPPASSEDFLKSIQSAEEQREMVSRERFIYDLYRVRGDVASGSNPTYDDPIFDALLTYAQSTPGCPGCSMREETDASKLLMKQLAEVRMSLDHIIYDKADCKTEPRSVTCARFEQAVKPFI